MSYSLYAFYLHNRSRLYGSLRERSVARWHKVEKLLSPNLSRERELGAITDR